MAACEYTLGNANRQLGADFAHKQKGEFGRYVFPINVLARVGIWFMVTLSLISAMDYFAAFWSKIDRQVVRRQRRAFILSRRRKRDVATT